MPNDPLIDPSLPKLRGGNDEAVRTDDLQRMFVDFLAWSQQPTQKRRANARAPIFAPQTNEEFWVGAGRLHEGADVLLEDFVVTEWLPTSPGRFFTPHAVEARRTASRFWGADQGEYLPLGKMHMVLGGVGSIRLASSESPDGRRFYLGATANGTAHEGIPLRLDESLYGDLVPAIKESGSCYVRIEGKLELLPDLPHLSWPLEVPRYCVRPVAVAILRPARRGTASVSLSVLFLGAAREYERHQKSPNSIGWTFVSFDPASKRGSGKLEAAVSWLKGYAQRHSVLSDPPIICDFDQHVRHFGDDVLFRLDEVALGQIDKELLSRYAKHLGLAINIGDRFENVVNSTIINRSVVTGRRTLPLWLDGSLSA